MGFVMSPFDSRVGLRYFVADFAHRLSRIMHCHDYDLASLSDFKRMCKHFQTTALQRYYKKSRDIFKMSLLNEHSLYQ